MPSQTIDTDEVTQKFLAYLDTFNAALDAHRDEFPYKQIVKGGEALLDGGNIGVALYKHDPSAPHDFHTITLEDGELKYVGRGKQNVRMGFKTKESRLEEVAENRDRYVEDPSKLELDWLKRKLGLQAS